METRLTKELSVDAAPSLIPLSAFSTIDRPGVTSFPAMPGLAEPIEIKVSKPELKPDAAPSEIELKHPAVPIPKELKGTFSYGPDSNIGEYGRILEAKDHCLIYALTHGISNKEVLQPLIKDFCSTRSSSRHISDWVSKDVLVRRNDTDPSKVTTWTMRTHQTRQDSSTLYALYLALYCSEPHVSLMLLEEMKDAQHAESVKKLFDDKQRNIFSKHQGLVFLHYYCDVTELERLLDTQIFLYNSGDYHHYNRDGRNPRSIKNLSVSVPVVRSKQEAFYLLEQHLLKIHPAYKINYSSTCCNTTPDLLKQYWKQRIARANSCEELNAVYLAGHQNPFINRSDSCVTKFFCCFPCKKVPPYHSAKKKFITQLQARAMDQVNTARTSSSPAEFSELCSALLSSPIFAEEHFNRGVTRIHQLALIKETAPVAKLTRVVVNL